MVRALFKDGTNYEIRQSIIKTLDSKDKEQKTKAEWIDLLNEYINYDCTLPETAAMLDLLAGKCQNKEMQDFFNENKSI